MLENFPKIPEKKESKQTSFAEPWNKKAFSPEVEARPAGEIKHVIKICRGINCGGKRSDILYQEIKDRFSQRADIDVSYCYCLGHCARGKNVVIDGKVINFVNLPQTLQLTLKKHIDRPDELAKAGLTSDDLETILFGSN